MPYKLFIISLLFALYSAAGIAAQPLDVVVVLDEAGVTDVNQRATVRTVLNGLSEKLNADSQIGLLAYAADTTEDLPLAPVSDPIISRLKLSDSTLTADTGKHNPVKALEKAIYRLRAKGRASAQKIILVLGDGRIDTGSPAQDQQLVQWLLGELSEASQQAKIRIYWLSFSEAADYRVIQTVTRKTRGNYYRVFSPSEALSAVDALILESSSAAPAGSAASPDVSASAAQRAQAPQSVAMPDDERPLSVWLLTAVAAFTSLLVLLTVGMLLKRRSAAKPSVPRKQPPAMDAPAILRDLTGFTAMREYDITNKKTYIGRLPREVTERSTVIVIRDATIGREHAVIEHYDNAYWISDTGTVNGTYVNERRLLEKQRLLNGDHIRFARFEFEIALPEAGEISPDFTGTETARSQKGAFSSPREQAVDDDRTVYRMY